MGYAIVIGLIIATLVIKLLFGFLAALFGDPLIVDSIALALIAGIASKNILDIHPAFALLIGIATFVLVTALSRYKFSFWIISLAMSLAWGLFFAILAFIFSNEDYIWFFVIFGLGFCLMIFAHVGSKRKIDREALAGADTVERT